MQALVDALLSYNNWANDRVISLCEGLSDDKLDQPREMGFGTLRATLFHILTADVIWLERWQGTPWRTFPTDPNHISLSDIRAGLADVAQRRAEWWQASGRSRWTEHVDFQDSKKTPFRLRLCDLMLHVIHHGVHHRAQALNYLKQFGRTVVGGIDYIFYRLAQGSLAQSEETREALKNYGLAVNDSLGPDVAWDATTVIRQFEYSDWAHGKILQIASGLSDQQLDRPFDMGPGSIRKTLLHTFDAERWWNANWTSGPSRFPHSPPKTSIADLTQSWRETAEVRDQFLADADNAEAHRVLEISFGGPPIRIQVGDSAVQFITHGTHHRAQLVNMLRHVGSPIGNIDLLYALHDLSQPKTS